MENKYEHMKKRMKELEQTIVLTKEDWEIKKDKWLGCCYESELEQFYGKYNE